MKDLVDFEGEYFTYFNCLTFDFVVDSLLVPISSHGLLSRLYFLALQLNFFGPQSILEWSC